MNTHVHLFTCDTALGSIDVFYHQKKIFHVVYLRSQTQELKGSNKATKQQEKNMFTVLDTLYSGKHSIVQRCKDTSKQQIVVCKFHKDDYPSAKLCNKYHKEFKLGCKFEKHGVAPKYLELRKYAHSEVILFEDEGLISLADYMTTVCIFCAHVIHFKELGSF